MKALKEKRIGLRSLLRRGLVILSLFALVFASCAASGGDDTPTGTNPPPTPQYKPASIEIISWPTKDSYEGRPVDLTGLEVRVYYDGGPENNKTISPAKGDTFSTYPHTAVGVIVTQTSPAADLWVPQLQYTLLWYAKDADKVFTAVLDLDKKGKTVIPISRAETWTDLSSSDQYNVYGSDDTALAWSRGLSLVGDLDAKIYVDDYPDFKRYRMQAEYVDAYKKEIDLTPETEWMILPFYDPTSTPVTPKSAVGDLYITVGRNELAATHPYVVDAITKAQTNLGTTLAAKATGRKHDPALTIRQPYDEIYVVKEITTNVTADDIEDFFYWMPDTEPAWTQRLIDSKATITVTYTGDNPGPKTKTVEEWAELNKVWKNQIFDPSTPITDPRVAEVPFSVQGVTETSTTNPKTALGRNRNPQIKISYRGAYAYVRMPVYTRPTAFVVTPKSGDPSVAVDMRPRDNDVGAMDAKAFDSLVDAIVTFQAYYDTSVTTELKVTFDTTGGIGTGGSGPYPAAYVTSPPPGIVATGADGAPGTGSEKKYSNNFGDVSENSRNNGRQTAVRFVYASPDLSTTGNFIEVGTRTLRGTVQVDWSNITM